MRTDDRLKDALDRKTLTFVTHGLAKSGKGHPATYPVLTPAGWKEMQDLSVGEFVVGSDGQPTEVIGVFRRGVLPTATVRFSDGSEVICDLDHLWAVRSNKTQDWQIVTTANLLNGDTLDRFLPMPRGGEYNFGFSCAVRTSDRKRRLQIPHLFAPIEFDEVSSLPLDPYVLGAWLGDGHASAGAITCGDVDVIKQIEMSGFSTVKRSNTDYTYGIYGLVTILKETGLFNNKHVPENYLHATVQDRLALLQGLMDTDGTTSAHTGSAIFTSTNRNLIESVAELSRSLGGSARIGSPLRKTYTHNEEKRVGKVAWNVTIKLPENMNPFRLKRKLQRYRPNTAQSKHPLDRRIDSVELTGEEEEIICIQVAAEDSLYITNDYVLTHNTTLGSTCPKPLLLLDAEGGTKFLNLRKVTWNPQLEPPPECDDDSWDACVVPVNDWSVMAHVFQWLAAGQHCFASLVVDSLSELQRRCKKALVGTDDMKMQAWGRLLTQMEDVVVQLRDLTEHPTNPLSVVMFICETTNKDERWTPYLQGALSRTLGYRTDLLGYLYVADVPDEVDPSIVHKRRQLLVGPDPTIEAGERVQGRLGQIVIEPDVCEMLDCVYDGTPG